MSRPILEDNQNCFVCGEKNALGFRLKFDHPEKGLLRSSAVFRPEHQGYRDIVHGGLMATLLDEMMVNLAWIEKTPAVTAELNVRLLKPVKTGETVRLEGRLERDGGRVLYMRAQARNARNELVAEASASCIRIRQGVD
jgi:uncharacterized protein (TIGR00369 family)